MIYFFNYSILALLASVRQPRKSDSVYAIHFIFLLFVFVFLTMFIGLRYEIGVDWFAYSLQVENISANFLSVFLLEDPGYQILNLLGSKWGGIFLVNSISALIFLFGFFVFSFKFSFVFRALSVSYPYLIVFVAMGYTRQSAAVGLLFISLTYCFERKFFLALIFVLFSMLFHKSAIIGLVFPIFTIGFKSKFAYIGLFLFAAFAAVFMLSPFGYVYFARYLNSGLVSSGSYLRLGLQFLAALAFFFNRCYFKRYFETGYNFCFFSSSVSVVLFLGVFILGGATFLDRVGLYFFPLQILVFCRLPDIYKFRFGGVNLINWLYLPYGISMLSIYLFFGNYVSYWLPYSFADLL